MITGALIGQCSQWHRHDEFPTFLNTINREATKGLQVHSILDDCGTNKHAEIDKWLLRHKRIHLHFPPDLLIASVEACLSAHNADQRPFALLEIRLCHANRIGN